MKPIFLFLLLLGCGSSGSSPAVCGNGKVERGEDCDDGAMNGQPGIGCSSSCTFVDIHNTTIQVTWNINAMAAPMFDTEPCFTVQHSGYRAQARVTLMGPGTSYTDEFACDPNSHMYVDQPSKPVPAGSYMVTVRLFEVNASDSTDKRDLTQDVSTMVTVGSMMQANAVVNFPYDKFLGTYSGTLFFQTAGWQQAGSPDAGTDAGGIIETTCAAAGVTKVRFFLRQNGQPVGGNLHTMATSGSPLDGIPMDGSAAGDCFDFAGLTTSYRVDFPVWGLYDLVIGGYANQSTNSLRFCSSSPIFVGAGGANPTYKLTTEAATSSVCP